MARDVDALLAVLPADLQAAAAALNGETLLEIVLDLGRPPEARLRDQVVRLAPSGVTREQLAHVLSGLGPLGDDNRAGIERTLHRISALRNRRGDVIGLTMRVGRAIFGTIDMLRDLVSSGRTLLLLGRPGVGKTTKLREMARVLADDLGKRVIVVDTSNEIGGDGDIPHPGIGGARRMQVSHPERQHAVMIEAVENHMPEVIIVDEIGTLAESAAARTIAERGVQLIGTAHGTTLENLISNPTLSDLVGGIHTVTLSDDEARRRNSMKTVTERRGPPTFDTVVEIVDHVEVVAHKNTAEAVDRLLAGLPVGGERRRVLEGEVRSEPNSRPAPPRTDAPSAGPKTLPQRNGRTRLYAHAVSRELLARMLDDLGITARLVDRADRADVILTLRARSNERDLREAALRGVPIHALKKNSSAEIRRVLRSIFGLLGGVDDEVVRDALADVEQAIERVRAEGKPVALPPRPPELRKAQHKLVIRNHLEAESTGTEPMRHLVVFPEGGIS